MTNALKVRQPTGVWLRPWHAQDAWRDRSPWMKLEIRELNARAWSSEYATCGHGDRDRGIKFVWLDRPEMWACVKCARGVPRAWPAGCVRCEMFDVDLCPGAQLSIVCVLLLLLTPSWHLVSLWLCAELCTDHTLSELEGV